MNGADQPTEAKAVPIAPNRERFSIPLPPSSRAKDITCYTFLLGPLSHAFWRLTTYRFTQAGRWFFAVTVLVAAFGSSSLELQAYVPFTYFFGVWLVALAGTKLFRPRVVLTARHADRLCAGETLPIDIELRQRRRLRAGSLSVIPNRLPPALDAVPEDGTSLPPPAYGKTAHARLGLRCNQRGVHRWHGFRVETDFPFSLLRAYRTYAEPHELLVYPRFTRLARLHIPTGRRYQPGGVALASNLGDSFEFIGSREYREGDNVRDIDWRATARLNMPIVREYREEYFLRVGVILDTHVPPAARWAERENFERAVSVCAAVGDVMARSDYIVDLFAAGPNLYHLTAGRSLAYLDQILDILACVNANPDEPFAVLEPEILESLAQITTVVCVFMDWNETRQAFTDRLRREGAGLKVIVVRDSPCTLDPHESDLPGGISVISRADFEAGIEEI